MAKDLNLEKCQYESRTELACIVRQPSDDGRVKDEPFAEAIRADELEQPLQISDSLHPQSEVALSDELQSTVACPGLKN